MRIGLVCPYNISKGGGVQECVCAMQTELTRRGHDVLIITPTPRETHNIKKDGVLYIGGATDIKSPFHTTAQVSVSVNTDLVDDMLEREKFDILHFHEPWVPILSRQILSRSTARNVATFHAKLPESMMIRTIEKVITPYTKSVMKYLDSLTAVSDAAADYVRSLTDKPIMIVPNGIDLDVYSNLATGNKKSKRRNILYIGRLERRKGVKFLIKSFAELVVQAPDVNLIIAGDGPDRVKLEKMVKEMNVPNVVFKGYVDEKTKHRLFRQADLLCSPALFGESFGIVLLEAMAAGIPVVAGNNPGYAAVLKDRGMLSLVNPKDTASFTRRLNLMLYDDDMRQLWQSWAAEYVQQFSYVNVVDAYEKIYKNLLKERRK